MCVITLKFQPNTLDNKPQFHDKWYEEERRSEFNGYKFTTK